MISNFTSKLTQELTLYVDGLQEKFPKQGYSLELNESNNIWEIKWKSSKHYEESFEIEIWLENEHYTLRGEHKVDDLMKQINDSYFIYEYRSIEVLISKMNEIIQKLKDAVLKINSIS